MLLRHDVAILIGCVLFDVLSAGASKPPFPRRRQTSLTRMPSASPSVMPTSVETPSLSPSTNPTLDDTLWPVLSNQSPSCVPSAEVVEDPVSAVVSADSAVSVLQSKHSYSMIKCSCFLIVVFILAWWMRWRRREGSAAVEALVVAALSGDDSDLKRMPKRRDMVGEIELTDFTKRHVAEDDPCEYAIMNDDDDGSTCQ